MIPECNRLEIKGAEIHRYNVYEMSKFLYSRDIISNVIISLSRAYLLGIIFWASIILVYVLYGPENEENKTGSILFAIIISISFSFVIAFYSYLNYLFDRSYKIFFRLVYYYINFLFIIAVILPAFTSISHAVLLYIKHGNDYKFLSFLLSLSFLFNIIFIYFYLEKFLDAANVLRKSRKVDLHKFRESFSLNKYTSTLRKILNVPDAIYSYRIYGLAIIPLSIITASIDGFTGFGLLYLNEIIIKSSIIQVDLLVNLAFEKDLIEIDFKDNFVVPYIFLGGIFFPIIAAFLLIFKILSSSLLYLVRLYSLYASQNAHYKRKKILLFLRSFDDDSVIIEHGVKSKLISLFHSNIKIKSIDMLLYEKYSDLGALIALGNPRDTLKPVGSTRYYYKGTSWKNNILKLFLKSRLIILCVSDSDGIKWEIEKIRELDLNKKTIFLFPPRLVKDKKYTLGFIEKITNTNLVSDDTHNDFDEILGFIYHKNILSIVEHTEYPDAYSYDAAIRQLISSLQLQKVSNKSFVGTG